MAKSKAKQIRTRDDDADSLEPYSDELDVSSPEVLETGDGGDVVGEEREEDWEDEDDSASTDDEEAEEDEDEDEEDEEEDDTSQDSQIDPDEAVKRKLNVLSFGALAKAQEAIGTPSGKKRKRAAHDSETEDKLDALRKRLKELQNERAAGHRGQPDRKPKAKDTVAPKSDIKSTNKRKSTFDDDDDDDRDSEDQHPSKQKGRASKHAPTVQSSRRAVTRRRNVVEVPKTHARDPRFDALTGPMDRDKIRRNYSFLDEYVDSEIKELKTVLKHQKALDNSGPSKKAVKKKLQKKGIPVLSPEETALLKKELVQKESRRAAQEAADRRKEVMVEHKRKEKELVRQGKKPFFLKEAEVKKQALVKRFEGMSEGKRNKVMEKKMKRVLGKEKKSMPRDRRA